MLRLSFRAILFVSVLALILMVTPAYSATITTYSTLSAWEAAASGVQSINFQGLVTTEPATSWGSSYTLDGVQFTGLSGSSIGVADTTNSYFSWADYGEGDALYAVASTTPSLQITLPTGTTAFSLNLYNSNGYSPSSFTASVFSTPYTVSTYNVPTVGFFGITSDTAIPSVTLTLQSTGGEYAFFNNVDWGTAQVTGAPEAGTFLLIGSGLLALAVTRRRKARQSQ